MTQRNIAKTSITLFFLFFTISFTKASTIISSTISCDSLDQLVNHLFNSSTVDDNEVRAISKQIYHLALAKRCQCLPQVLNLEAFQYYGKNDSRNAKKLLIQAEGILMTKGDQKIVLAKNQLFLGLVYVLEDQHESAIKYFEKSIKLYEGIGDEIGIIDASMNLGMAYIENKEFDRAEELLQYTYKESSAKKKLDIKGYSLQNLSRLYHEINKIDDALYYAELAEKNWEKMDYDKGLYYINFAFAEIYKTINNTELQIERLQKCLAHGEKVEFYIYKHIALIELGEIYLKTNKIEKARDCYEKALEQGQYFTANDFNALLPNLVSIYIKQNDFGKVGQMIEKVTEFNTRLVEDVKVESDKWVNSENSLENKISENEKLFASKEENEIKVRQQQMWIILFLSLFAGAILFAYLLFKQSKVRKELLGKNRIQNSTLLENNKKLESLAATIVLQNKALADKNEELKNFAAIASHDLKSPARTIINFTGLLKRKIKRNVDSEELLSLVETIEKSSRNMYALIIDLLEYAKLEKTKLNLEALEIEDLVYDILLDLQSVIEDKKAEIEIDKLPQKIIGDPIKLKQVFLNLLNNGLKFTSKGKIPHIQLSAEESDTDYIFHIKDNGIGIDEKYKEKIFSMFQRLNSMETYDGTGIGLATCQKVVELHQGEIWVNSKVGEGSTFSFSISKSLTPDTPQRTDALVTN